MPKNSTKNQVTPVQDESVLEDILTRGVAEIIPQDEFVRKLKAGERMSIYLGVDPTGPSIHLGHAIHLWKLRKLQELGHDIILLIGDFTARIGDPTDRNAARTALTHEEVLENANTYQQQAAKILDFEGENPARIEYNASWLDELNFHDVLQLSAKFTVQQMLERDMFEKRLEEGKPIYVHEFMYPLMQGYDSVAMNVDGEIGGTDQLFNMLAGRTLQKEMNSREKFVLTIDLIEGLDGRKMSKSYGNIVGVSDEPNDMYGKLMALDDSLIEKYFYLCANYSLEESQQKGQELKDGAHPRDIKIELARAVVALYYSDDAAQNAEAEFQAVFQGKGKPQDIPEYILQNEKTLLDVLVGSEMAASKSEARRLLSQGGVRVNDEKITDEQFDGFEDGTILQVGKRRFLTLRVQS